MFQKSKDPITRIGLGIIGTIGVVLILIAGWSTFFASGPQPGGLDTAEGQAGQADDGPPVGPLPQVGDGESHESVREEIETADEELPMAPEGEGTAAQDAARETGEAVTIGADPEAGTDAAESETLAADDPPPLQVGDDAQSAQAADEGTRQAGAQEQAQADTGTQEQAQADAGAQEQAQADTGAQEQAQADAGAQAEGAAAGGGAPFSEEGMALVSADAEAGARVWNQCRACHVADAEQNRVGPHLVGMVGREVASVDGFRYSDALQNLETEHWTPEELDAWLADPRGYAPGTTMSFQGLRNPEDRANLLTWFYESQQGQ